MGTSEIVSMKISDSISASLNSNKMTSLESLHNEFISRCLSLREGENNIKDIKIPNKASCLSIKPSKSSS